MSNPLDSFLAMYSREAREISLCLRQLILEVFPSAVELVDLKSGVIAYVYGGKSRMALVFAIAPRMKYVNLMFSKGNQIADPERRLAGTGKQARHIKIKSEMEIEMPALRQLLKEALKLNYED